MYGSLNSKQNYPQKDIRVFPIFIHLAEISASFSKNIKTHGLIHRTGPSWPKFRPGPSKVEVTSPKWIPMTVDMRKEHRCTDT